MKSQLLLLIAFTGGIAIGILIPHAKPWRVVIATLLTGLIYNIVNTYL